MQLESGGASDVSEVTSPMSPVKEDKTFAKEKQNGNEGGNIEQQKTQNNNVSKYLWPRS